MTVKIGVVMDPIETIKPYKDSTLAILLEAQRRNWEINYMLQDDLFIEDGIVKAKMRPLMVFDNNDTWFKLGVAETKTLPHLEVILMRKDPPFDMNYLYTTYLLELVEAQGTLVVNKPQSLRDANEKLFVSWFGQFAPEYIVSSDKELLRDFIKQYQHVICKPLDSMGGKSIFSIKSGDPNTNVTIETLTDNGRRLIMVQRFVPEITQGDKRIILINGYPIAYGLTRLPHGDDFRANLAVGGQGQGFKLNHRDFDICDALGPTLRKKGILFAGIDVIGDYITEINVTSPTCIREIDKAFNLNIAANLCDVMEKMI